MRREMKRSSPTVGSAVVLWETVNIQLRIVLRRGQIAGMKNRGELTMYPYEWPELHFGPHTATESALPTPVTGRLTYVLSKSRRNTGNFDEVVARARDCVRAGRAAESRRLRHIPVG